MVASSGKRRGVMKAWKKNRRTRPQSSPDVGAGYVPVPRYKMGLRMNELVTTRMWRLSNQSFTVLNWSNYIEFKLNQLPSYNEFSTLFDMYKIFKVECEFIPKYNSADFSSGGTAYGLPTLYIVEDRNSVATPSSINTLMEYASCKKARFDRPVKYTCWPTIHQSNPDGDVIDMAQKELYCNSFNTGIPHRGLIYGCDLPIGTEVFRYDVVFKFFMKFKDVK